MRARQTIQLQAGGTMHLLLTCILTIPNQHPMMIKLTLLSQFTAHQQAASGYLYL